MLLTRSSFEKHKSIRRPPGAKPIVSDTIWFTVTSIQAFEVSTKEFLKNRKRVVYVKPTESYDEMAQTVTNSSTFVRNPGRSNAFPFEIPDVLRTLTGR
jgi:hypothetical protein